MTKKECLQELHKRTGGEESYSATETHWFYKDQTTGRTHSISQFVNGVCFIGGGSTWEECLDDLDETIKRSVVEARAKLEATAAIEVHYD